MREIKFRAWDGSKMEHHVMAGFLGVFYVPGLDPRDAGSVSPFNTIYSNQTPVMQYTGLKDKNGVEIYEGDIMRRYGGGLLGDLNTEIFTGEVVFTKHGYKAKYTASEPGTAGSITEERYGNLFNESEIEVIGNIYENPELVK